MPIQSLQISRILHAGYLFDDGKTKILFDPIFENPFSRNCYAFPSVRFDHEQIENLQFDAIFISHFHDDHCSLESLDLIDRQTPIYVYCVFEEIFFLIKELGFTQVFPLEINRSVTVGSFEIIPRRALDPDVDTLFHIKAVGLNVLNVVDSWIDPLTLNELARYAPWDLVLWPFQTLREIDVLSPSRAPPVSNELPHEWIEQLQLLSPRYVVPSSCQFIHENWSWYNHAMFPVSYRQFEQEIGTALPTARTIRLDPSVTIILSPYSIEKGPSLSWVLREDDQDVDYDYKRDFRPPSTAEISKNFASLNQEQLERVLNFCCRDLLEKYRELVPREESYFQQKRFWQLSVYDHHGKAIHFQYSLSSRDISLEPTMVERPLSWFTEVPLFKLFAALELGESLTSMYLRINERIFSPEIEDELQSVDILEDPLVRCLFDGVFGAYQKAQLKKLKSDLI